MYLLKRIIFITAEFLVMLQYEGNRFAWHMKFQKEVNDNINMNFKERGFRAWKLD
jgi:hypothetical protein